MSGKTDVVRFRPGTGTIAGIVSVCVLLLVDDVSAQPVNPAREQEFRSALEQIESRLNRMRQDDRFGDDPLFSRSVTDIAVFAKAVDWCLRHEEFYKPDFNNQVAKVLRLGRQRADELEGGKTSWRNRSGRSIHAYTSRVDGSVQPYAITLPRSFDAGASAHWPLHVVLHGRAGTMNEMNFIFRHEGKPAPADQSWIQLDVFGRTNNAYRWSGETDVFEALRDVQHRHRIDARRITLRGFSMGGAGAWHLGLHHPDRWCSVGPGAGFVDFYEYQKQSEQRPVHQHRTLGIYDAVDYALNAFNVPVCTYGGELDAQLLASTTMVTAAKQFEVPVKLIVGPGMGHKFHPDSEREFMAFHQEASRKGRPGFPGPKHVRFTTRTLRYNSCDWLTVEEMITPYERATIDARVNDDGDLEVTTHNAAVLRIARDIGDQIIIDGERLPLYEAADGLLPDVYFSLGRDGWQGMTYDESRSFQRNEDDSVPRKRHGLQGPIDDAFMDSFLCVRGTGQPWSSTHQQWADWTLGRFDREFDKWYRGRVRIIDDSELTEELIGQHHLILFGDPGSNSAIAKVVTALKGPTFAWDRDGFRIGKQTYATDEHAWSMIYPNPLNPKRYVVLNSGHTFHEKDFKASNSWLFPRLGDIAVQKFRRIGNGGFDETTLWADIFDSGWQLRPATKTATRSLP